MTGPELQTRVCLDSSFVLVCLDKEQIAPHAPFVACIATDTIDIRKFLIPVHTWKVVRLRHLAAIELTEM